MKLVAFRCRKGRGLRGYCRQSITLRAELLLTKWQTAILYSLGVEIHQTNRASALAALLRDVLKWAVNLSPSPYVHMDLGASSPLCSSPFQATANHWTAHLLWAQTLSAVGRNHMSEIPSVNSTHEQGNALKSKTF